jgi:GDPmannose 4,6-dehydratase
MLLFVSYRMLNAIRTAGLEESCRFYQSASAELFGNATQVPQTEDTPFAPRSPYGIAKQFCYWMGKNYRGV